MQCGRSSFFFFQAEDGIRDVAVTGVQTCALPISADAAEPKSVSGPRQFTDTCRVAGSPADPSRTTHQDELRRAPRVVDGNDAGTRSSCAAKAAARPVPLKRAERRQFTDTRTTGSPPH